MATLNCGMLWAVAASSSLLGANHIFTQLALQYLFFLLHGVTATWALTEQVDLVTTKTLKNNTVNRHTSY